MKNLFFRLDKVGIIEYLIANGAEVNAVNYDYQTPLYSSILGGFYAARNLDKLQVVKTLLKHNANPNISDTNHQTPLHIAAGDPSNGRFSMTLRDKNLIAILFSILGRAEIVKALRNAGAKKDLKNKFGQTPLEIAQEKGIYFEDFTREWNKMIQFLDILLSKQVTPT